MWLVGVAVALAAVLLLRKIYQICTYWNAKGVAQRSPFSMFVEIIKLNLKYYSLADVVRNEYNVFPGKRYMGTYQFGVSTLLIRDPELIKQITVKEFDHFTDHRVIVADDYEPLWAKNLFSLRGDKWKNMRATLSPAFTSSKMKAMFALMSEAGEQFTNHFLEANKEVSVELKDTFTRFTNDVIATCAFGIKCDSLKDRENDFYVMGKDATDFSGFWKTFTFILYTVSPRLTKILGLRMFSKKVSDFFITLIADTVKAREENNIVRPDMIHLLMEAKKGCLKYEEDPANKETGFATVEESHIGKSLKETKNEITDVDMASQALIFFFGGFDSVSTFMCFMAYELAVNTDIQDRLRDEIDSSIHENGGKLTYEGMNNMKYLDMVTAETLRKWPAGIAVDRCCTARYTIEPKHPEEQPIVLEKGDVVWIPIYGFHRDPQYFTNPDRFDPERFNDENRNNIEPYTYIPFGAGPRNCIASRFAILETKTVICHILSKFELTVVEKTQIPLRLSTKSFNLNAEKGFWTGLKPRNIEVTTL